jgi:hypothetical protein
MKKGPIAQLEELPAHNRSVPGSNPGGPIRLFLISPEKERVFAVPGKKEIIG